jgi:hypothetical protein
VTGFLSAGQDVTERRLAEESLRASEANLKAVADAIRTVQTSADARSIDGPQRLSCVCRLSASSDSWTEDRVHRPARRAQLTPTASGAAVVMATDGGS